MPTRRDFFKTTAGTLIASTAFDKAAFAEQGQNQEAARFFLSKKYVFPSEYIDPWELPKPKGKYPYEIDLNDVLKLSKEDYARKFANGIKFHTVGDTGSSETSEADARYRDRVIQIMEERRKGDKDQNIAFFYHLGDVVYDNGTKMEPNAYKQRYQAQVYDSFSMTKYGLPKFAIPGSHDHWSDKISAFCENFCNPANVNGGIWAKVGIGYQPNHYWILKTPFVNIIGLSTNRASKGYIDAEQYLWFYESIRRFKAANMPFIVAIHFAPLSAEAADHREECGSIITYKQTNAVYNQVGHHPHLVLSGHFHNYQRLTHTRSNNHQTTHIVAGCGGKELYDYRYEGRKKYFKAGDSDYLPDGSTVEMKKDHTYTDNPDVNNPVDFAFFGFLEISVNNQTIDGKFITANPHIKHKVEDEFSINIKSRRIN